MSAELAPPVVILCGDLQDADGADAAALAERLRARFGGIAVSVVADACGDPATLRAALSGTDRAVLGVCSPPDRALLQATARSAGVDPLAVETVVLQGTSSNARAARLLAAALARSRRYRGSRPEHVVPRAPRTRTRRSLLSLGPMTYEVVPSIDARRCAVRVGCTLCVGTCPRGALRRLDGHMDLDRAACSGCALCAFACPRDAITFPTHTDERLAAEIGALLEVAEDDPSTTTVAFVCRSADSARERVEPAWLPVEVPCLGALSPVWPLRCVAAGASEVVLVGCEECPVSADVRQGAEWCVELLSRVGLADRVRRISIDPQAASPSAAPVSPERSRVWSGTHRSASSIVALLGSVGGDALDDLAHPGSPFGMVSLSTNACTLCGACAAACPSDALELRTAAAEVSLTFDHGRCVACGLCAAACPEGSAVLTVDRVTSPRALAQHRATLHRDVQARCVSCGEPIAPRALLRRVTSLLADQPQVAAALERHCTACRDRPVPTDGGYGR